MPTTFEASPMQALKTFRVYKRLRNNVAAQRAFNAVFLAELLNSLETRHHGEFAPMLRNKITGYYSLFGPTLCKCYCELIGKDFTSDERERAIVLSIATPLYDDFFDNGTLALQKIESIAADPRSYDATTFEEKVFRDLSIWLTEHLPHEQGYRETVKNIYEAQVASLQQKDSAISDALLHEITFNKSYHGLLLYHRMLDVEPTAEFQELLQPMTRLLQIGNDAFDVHKDLQNGIYTLPNLHRDMPLLMKKYRDDARLFNRLTRSLPYPVERKEHYRFAVNFVIALGYVALRRLEKLLTTLPPNVDLKTVARPTHLRYAEALEHNALADLHRSLLPHALKTLQSKKPTAIG